MQTIQESIRNLSDDDLLEQFIRHRTEFTPEAVETMAGEIRKRNLSEKMAQLESDFSAQQTNAALYAEESFIPIEHTFSLIDISLANTLLSEQKIPALVESTLGSEVLPNLEEKHVFYTIHVPKELKDKAIAALEHHFEPRDGKYAQKFSSIKERLKSFSFHELRLSPEELNEAVEISLSYDEATKIINYLDRILKEADAVEEKTGRVLFYFDNYEQCREMLKSGDAIHATRIDLLTIMEVVQAYCDEPSFPQSLEKTADSLLSFFIRV